MDPNPKVEQLILDPGERGMITEVFQYFLGDYWREYRGHAPDDQDFVKFYEAANKFYHALTGFWYVMGGDVDADTWQAAVSLAYEARRD